MKENISTTNNEILLAIIMWMWFKHIVTILMMVNCVHPVMEEVSEQK